MNIGLKFSLLLLSVSLMVSCKYDKETETIEPVVNTNLCDSVPTSFSADVLPLLKNNCTPCHVDGGASGGHSWDNYAEVSADADLILKAIKQDGGAVFMPQGRDKLPDDTIQVIECWIENGKLDD